MKNFIRKSINSLIFFYKFKAIIGTKLGEMVEITFVLQDLSLELNLAHKILHAWKKPLFTAIWSNKVVFAQIQSK